MDVRKSPENILFNIRFFFKINVVLSLSFYIKEIEHIFILFSFEMINEIWQTKRLFAVFRVFRVLVYICMCVVSDVSFPRVLTVSKHRIEKTLNRDGKSTKKELELCIKKNHIYSVYSDNDRYWYNQVPLNLIYSLFTGDLNKGAYILHNWKCYKNCITGFMQNMLSAYTWVFPQ